MEHIYAGHIQGKRAVSMGQIKIVNAGLMTTVQDLGRYGYQQYGMSVSGAMDHAAAMQANILVGNDDGEGLLEVTIMGPAIEFLSPAVFAVTGGDLQPTINGDSVQLNKSISANAGDRLAFKGLKKGCRSYVAFAGGIDVPVVMGSKSTFIKANLGGFEGRALKPGDILSIGNPKAFMSDLAGRCLNEDFYDYGSDIIELRVVLGPQDDAFTSEGIETLFSSIYTASNNCDRMGYTLEGDKIQHKEGADIISDGISMGAIQVPSKGNPIIMMADRQTTGGYTKIGNVITVDLPKIAQAKPGDKIKFKKTTIEEAHNLIKEFNKKISEAKSNLAAQAQSKREIINTKIFNIRVNGNAYSVQVEELK